MTAGGQPTAQVARDLGSTPNLLRRRKPAVAAFPGKGRRKPHDEALARLTRDLACGTQERGFVTRGAAILRQAVGMRCQAMQAHTGRVLVRLMCRLLAVSPSGYSVWMAQPESLRTVENRRLLMEIRGIHAESQRTDGSPWVHPTLQAQGRRIGEHRVAAAVFVVQANGWMNTPRGFRLFDGRATEIDPLPACCRPRTWSGGCSSAVSDLVGHVPSRSRPD